MAKKDKDKDKAKDAKDAKDEKAGAKPEGDKPEGGEGAEGEAAPKKSKKKLIIIILIALLVLGGGAAGLILSGVLGGSKTAVGKDGKPVAAKDAKDKDEKDAKDNGPYELDKDGKPVLDKDGKPVPAKPIYFDMPDIIVNLNSPSPRPHFVNLKLTLEVSSQDNLKKVQDTMPRIIDSFNTYLREVRREDLQGSAGSYRLKTELNTRLTKILGDGVVTDILFKEIIVQ